VVLRSCWAGRCIGKAEEIALVRRDHDQGLAGAVDQILSSRSRTLLDTVPSRHRVVGSREVGETPSISPRLRLTTVPPWSPGLPPRSSTQERSSLPARAKQRRGGFPENYLPWVRSPCRPCAPDAGRPSGNAAWITLSKAPNRSIGR